MSVGPATSRREVPIWFDAGDERLFGIHTLAAEPARGVGVIIAAGGGTPLAVNVNDLSVRLCRTLSGHGFDSFRFDYHGVGESTGALERFHLAEPFVLDLNAAAGCLRDRGITRLVLVGSCFGARTVLAAAPVIEGVERVVLMAPPVRDFEMGERVATRMAEQSSLAGYMRRAVKVKTIRNLGNARIRRAYVRLAKEKIRHTVSSGSSSSEGRAARYEVSPRFVDPLRALVANGVPISVIFGDHDDFRDDFERALDGPLGKVLENATAGFEMTVVPGEIHGFTSVVAQDQAMEAIVSQLSRLPRD